MQFIFNIAKQAKAGPSGTPTEPHAYLAAVSAQGMLLAYSAESI